MDRNTRTVDTARVRKELAEDVLAFLAAGSKIEVLPPPSPPVDEPDPLRLITIRNERRTKSEVIADLRQATAVRQQASEEIPLGNMKRILLDQVSLDRQSGRATSVPKGRRGRPRLNPETTVNEVRKLRDQRVKGALWDRLRPHLSAEPRSCKELLRAVGMEFTNSNRIRLGAALKGRDGIDKDVHTNQQTTVTRYRLRD